MGLSVNSISIYSDAVNNLFDCLSGLLAFVCLMLVSRDRSFGAKALIKNCENLLTLIMSVIVGISGFYFAYSSVERLMYPTPLWYREKYLYILIFTAAAKLAMHFIFKRLYKKSASPLIKVMSFDSLLDFFITAVTVVSLIASTYATYSVDAYCGIGIGSVVFVSAVKMIASGVKKLIGFVPKDSREFLSQRLTDSLGGHAIEDIEYFLGGDKPTALVRVSPRTSRSTEAIAQIENETGFTVHIIKGKECADNLCNYENEN